MRLNLEWIEAKITRFCRARPALSCFLVLVGCPLGIFAAVGLGAAVLLAPAAWLLGWGL